jgi:anti-sigma regulatory factor (Ser/Thr protein kinase)
LAAWLAPRAVPADTAFAMRLCLEEAMANIAMHGNPDGEVVIGASLAEESGRLVLSIRDDGHAFDPASAELPQGRDIGGNGLLLLRRYCGDIGYRRAEGGNELTLRFTLPDESPAPGR